jgi:hypothetical protein
MRRQKLTYPIAFPKELKANTFYSNNSNDSNDNNSNDNGNNNGNNNNDDVYEFNSCIVHSGSANGGHYKCLTRSSNGKFIDCNDGIVTVLTDEEEHELFNPIDDVISKKHSLIHENGYIFTYCRKDNINSTPIDTIIPTDIQAQVDELNNHLAILQKLYHDVHQCMISIQVILEGFVKYPNVEAISTLAIDVHHDTTLDELLDHILHTISSKELDDGEKQLLDILVNMKSKRVRLCKAACNSTSK